MVLNPNTICKPLNFRELDFYQNIQDQDIKMFVPNYKGKMSKFKNENHNNQTKNKNQIKTNYYY